MTLLPALSRDLEAAAERQATRHARRRRLGLSGFAMVGVLVVGGAATAATGIWSPQVGDDRRGTPRISGSEVPQEQLDHFAVLRRDATQADRGPAVRSALTFLSPKYDGIRTESVRLLDPGVEGDKVAGATVLYPVERTDGKRDALCLFVTDPADGGGTACTDTRGALDGELLIGMMQTAQPEPGSPEARRRQRAFKRAARAAKARGDNGVTVPWTDPVVAQRVIGLVPDGVDRVVWRRGSRTVDAPVRNNLYVLRIDHPDRSRTSPSTIAWIDADGREVRTRPGMF